MDDIKNILKKKNYYVTSMAEGDTITVKFPKKVLGPFRLSAYEATYKATPKGVTINTRGDSYRIPCPSYAKKLIVQSDVVLRCTILGYNDLLCIGELQECMDQTIKFTEDDVNLEYNLTSLLSASIGLPDKDEEVEQALAEEMQVSDGYTAYCQYAFKRKLTYDKKLLKEIGEGIFEE